MPWYYACHLATHFFILWYTMGTVKINKKKPHQNGVRRPEGGALRQPVMSVTERIVKDPNRIVHRKEALVIDPTGKDGCHVSYKISDASTTQPVKHYHLPELSVVSNRLLFNLSQLSTFSP